MSLFDKLFKKDEPEKEEGGDGGSNSYPYQVQHDGQGGRVVGEEFEDQNGRIIYRVIYNDAKDDDGSLQAGAERHALRGRKN